MIDISQIGESLRQDAVTVVFVNVLLQQLGLPVPAVPTLLLAGSLAAAPGSLGTLLAAAVAASVLADWLWYGLGQRFGYRVLAGLCQLSINPSSCVSQTEARFLRWGVSSLVVAKFIPGFSTVAPPIAGALRMSLAGFLLAAAAGAGPLPATCKRWRVRRSMSRSWPRSSRSQNDSAIPEAPARAVRPMR